MVDQSRLIYVFGDRVVEVWRNGSSVCIRTSASSQRDHVELDYTQAKILGGTLLDLVKAIEN